MGKIVIDQDRCDRDGLCTKVCPTGTIVQQNRDTLPGTTDEDRCIACGQCVAVCPRDAIAHEDVPPEWIHPIAFDRMPSFGQFKALIQSRRSIRAVQEEPLARSDMETIIDAARCAPSGQNSQSTEYSVVQDRERLRKISALCVDYFRFEVRRLSNPFFRVFVVLLGKRETLGIGMAQLPRFRSIIRFFEAGGDPILYNAHLAFQNASLAAHGLEIGHHFGGWVFTLCWVPMGRRWAEGISVLTGAPPGTGCRP